MHVNRLRGRRPRQRASPRLAPELVAAAVFMSWVTNCHRWIMQRFQPNKVQHMQCGSDGDNRARL